MAKYIDIEKEITEMQQVVEFYKDKKTFEAETTSFAFQAIIDKLKQVPAADVAPVVHGEWIKDKGYMLSRCSVCQNTIPLGREYKHKYCPACGAKMDKTEG